MQFFFLVCDDNVNTENNNLYYNIHVIQPQLNVSTADAQLTLQTLRPTGSSRSQEAPKRFH